MTKWKDQMTEEYRGSMGKYKRSTFGGNDRNALIKWIQKPRYCTYANTIYMVIVTCQ